MIKSELIKNKKITDVYTGKRRERTGYRTDEAHALVCEKGKHTENVE